MRRNVESGLPEGETIVIFKRRAAATHQNRRQRVCSRGYASDAFGLAV